MKMKPLLLQAKFMTLYDSDNLSSEIDRSGLLKAQRPSHGTRGDTCNFFRFQRTTAMSVFFFCGVH